ncbi:hypothetical protein D918_06553 [Trichuris suis]|nr:hypothetical protein D918_06553 [Trichuris suis]
MLIWSLPAAYLDRHMASISPAIFLLTSFCLAAEVQNVPQSCATSVKLLRGRNYTLEDLTKDERLPDVRQTDICGEEFCCSGPLMDSLLQQTKEHLVSWIEKVNIPLMNFLNEQRDSIQGKATHSIILKTHMNCLLCFGQSYLLCQTCKAYEKYFCRCYNAS